MRREIAIIAMLAVATVVGLLTLHATTQLRTEIETMAETAGDPLKLEAEWQHTHDNGVVTTYRVITPRLESDTDATHAARHVAAVEALQAELAGQ